MTEVRTTSRTGGQKGTKPERFDLIPVGALAALARHYGAGAEKYDDNQWRKGYEWSKSGCSSMNVSSANACQATAAMCDDPVSSSMSSPAHHAVR